MLMVALSRPAMEAEIVLGATKLTPADVMAKPVACAGAAEIAFSGARMQHIARTLMFDRLRVTCPTGVSRSGTVISGRLCGKYDLKRCIEHPW